MRNLTEITTKIKKHYVGEGFIQVMAAWQSSLAIIGSEGIKYSKDHIKVNSYITDERRNHFPFSNIPEHFELGFSNNYKYVNQILNTNEPYIQIVDGKVQELYASQTTEGTFLTTKLLPPELKETIIMIREELDQFSGVGKDNNYVVDISSASIGNSFIREEEMLKRRKENLITFLEHSKELNNTTPLTWKDINILESLIDTLTLEDLPKNIQYNLNLLVSTENNQLNAKMMQVTFLDVNKYRVEIYNVPLIIADIDYLKSKYNNLGKIKYQSEPRITYLENYPYYPYNIIKEEQGRARKLKRM